MYFRNIDLLRGFAALSVLVYHVIELLPWPTFPGYPSVWSWFRIGWLGVDLFFVISGFVITLTAIQSYRSDPTDFAAGYLRRRLGRIVPLHVLTLFFFILFIAPTLLTHPDFFWHLGTHLLFVHNLNIDTHGSINGVNWSVGVEMQFYLLVLLTVRWLSAVSPWRLLALCLLLSWSWRGGVYWLLAGPEANTSVLFFYATQLPGMLDEFAFGFLLARWLLDGGVVRQGWLWALAAGLLGWLALSLFWPRAGFWHLPEMVIFWRSLAGLAFCALVGVAVFVRLPPVVDRLLQPLRYLGQISYGIYLWHLLVISALLKAGLHNPPVFLALTLLFTLLLAAGSWTFFEQPLLRRCQRPLFTRLLRPGQTSAPAVPAPHPSSASG